MTPHPPERLRCEYLADPIGVDTALPRLSWVVESPVRGAYPKAYQVLVSSAPELLRSDIGDLWDTGRAEMEGFATLEYAGEPLASCARYAWKVRWWDGQDQVSPWSETASTTANAMTPASSSTAGTSRVSTTEPGKKL